MVISDNSLQTKVNVVLDLDGVLADFASHAKLFLNRSLTSAEVELSRPEFVILNDPANAFWQNLPPLPGAILLREFSPLPENVYILTSRNELVTRSATEMWLHKWGIQLQPKRLLFANPCPEKLNILSRLTPLVFVDDSILNVGMADKLPHVDARLMVQPHNIKALVYFPAIRPIESLKELTVLFD